MKRPKQAIFLVGGRGTRLGALSVDTPKPMQEIAPGIRFLDILLEHAARHGFTDIVLLAGHLGEKVEAAYHGKAVHEAKVRVLRELEPMGTGGALKLFADVLDPSFLLSNGDSFLDINLRELTARPLGDSLARLALRRVDDISRFGSVALEGDRITAFLEKNAARGGPGLINGGVYFLRREIVSRLASPCSLEVDVFPMLASEKSIEGTTFDGYFLDIGLPETLAQAKAETAARRVKPAVILDRDGVLNVDSGYTHKPEDLVWQPGTREAIRLLNDRGYYVIVATNQAGVARGFYSEEAIAVFHAHMQEQLAEAGAHIDAFYHCPFHPEGKVDRYCVADHPDRKPNPGMILRAFSEWPIDTSRSFLIGDRDSDIEAARRAGIPGYLYKGGDLAALVRSLIGET
ncbi:MAG TPA: HAD-IIIA family hydrolase [Hyphomonadaceae bacterium]|nr:HAD-IIIA family hydrolase [Hyphomonadaceae bacterium]